MKGLLKRIFFTLNAHDTLPNDHAAILMYHSIGDNDAEFTVSRNTFEEQMKYLRGTNAPVIPVRELVRRLYSREALGGAVAITFDDGYRDNFVDAFPVLQKYNFPATVFVITDRIGTHRRGFQYCSAEELRAMEQSGLVDIEPHTKSHPHLAREPLERQREEITVSKEVLETITGKKCEVFAYPYGSFSDNTVTIVREAGFAAGVSVVPGTVNPDSDLMRLPRNHVGRSTSPAQFKGIVSGAVDRYEALKKWL